MKCPKCEEGIITKIKFKKTEKIAYLCDFCETVWTEGEDINFNTGHALRSHTEGRDLAYTVEAAGEKDQEHTPAKHTDYT